MIMDKLLKNMLKEELTPMQKSVVDNYKRGGYQFTDKIFGGKNQHRLYIPLQSQQSDPVPPQSVKDHVESLGFNIHDYKNGLAKDKHGRDVRIGRILSHPKNGNPSALKEFNDDQAKRGSKKDDDHVVCITRHPHDVAGMSTNRGWTSCMDLERGSNKHYLKTDIAHGTHVAYLIHKDDPEIKNPIARIALKKHVPEKQYSPLRGYYKLPASTHVLRPEERQYGTGNDAFAHTVRKWTEDNMPMKAPVYEKHENLYNDDSNEIVLSNLPEHAEAQINHPYHAVKMAVIKRDREPEMHMMLDKIDKQKSSDHLYRLSDVANSRHKSVGDRLLAMPEVEKYPRILHRIAAQGHMEHLDKIVHRYNDPDAVVEVLKHGHMKHVDAAIENFSKLHNRNIAEPVHVRPLQFLARNTKNPEVAEKVLNAVHPTNDTPYHKDVLSSVLANDNLPRDYYMSKVGHVFSSGMINHMDKSAKREIAERTDNPRHLDMIYEHGDYFAHVMAAHAIRLNHTPLLEKMSKNPEEAEAVSEEMSLNPVIGEKGNVKNNPDHHQIHLNVIEHHPARGFMPYTVAKNMARLHAAHPTEKSHEIYSAILKKHPELHNEVPLINLKDAIDNFKGSVK